MSLKNRSLLNRRGETGDQLMAFTFFFMLFIIAVAIVAGVTVFYGNGYDFRAAEAQVLNSHVRNCVLDNSLDSIKNDFYSVCGLDKNISSYPDSVRICLGNGDCAAASGKDILFSVGSNFQSCDFNGVKGNDAFQKCFQSNLIKEGQNITIITASNQHVSQD